MSYATPLQMLRYGEDALAQLCTAYLGEVLAANLLEAALRDADLSAYSAAEQQLAASAIAWIQDAIDSASIDINSYLRKYSLPLSQVQIDGSSLPKYTRVLAYYELMINGADEKAQTQYDQAMIWLKNVSTGLANIGGVAETEAVAIENRRQTAPAKSNIDWGNY